MSEAQQTLKEGATELAEVARFASSLPAACRQALTLRKVYGYSGREIATRLGIPEQAVEELLIKAVRAYAPADDLEVQTLGLRPSILAMLRLRFAHV
jgi:DNA-directed RNA polymerase specialized sigma24 family protein